MSVCCEFMVWVMTLVFVWLLCEYALDRVLSLLGFIKLFVYVFDGCGFVCTFLTLILV